MAGQDLGGATHDLERDGGAVVQARWRSVHGFGTEGKEMIHGFVGIGKGVADADRRDDLKDFKDDRAESIGDLFRFLGLARLAQFDHPRQAFDYRRLTHARLAHQHR